MHSEDTLEMGVPGIIALALIGLVLIFIIVVVACSYLRGSSLPAGGRNRQGIHGNNISIGPSD